MDGFRIYNPAIGKFLSVDPLTRDYPWYTPYQFAGNKPIWAVDLDGLEEKYMIKKIGKLSEPVISFLQAAFNYSSKGVNEVTWYSDAKYNGEGFVVAAKAKRYAASKAFSQRMDAITLSSREVVYRSGFSKKGDIDWLSLIAHEQSHVEDYLNLGQFGFYADYAVDVAELGYKHAFSEELAYARGDALKTWLKKNTRFLDALKNPFELNSQLKNLGIEEGKRFRKEVGIDAEIKFWVIKAQYLNARISAVKSSKMANKESAIKIYQNMIKNIRREITDLQTEKENLCNE